MKSNDNKSRATLYTLKMHTLTEVIGYVQSQHDSATMILTTDLTFLS